MRMELEEFLLALLAEEAVEISQRAIKCIRFGMQDCQSPEHETNKWRLYNEITDLRVILDFMRSNEIFDFDEMLREEQGDHYANKWMAVLDWAAYSAKVGKLSVQACAQLRNEVRD